MILVVWLLVLMGYAVLAGLLLWLFCTAAGVMAEDAQAGDDNEERY